MKYLRILPFLLLPLMMFQEQQGCASASNIQSEPPRADAKTCFVDSQCEFGKRCIKSKYGAQKYCYSKEEVKLQEDEKCSFEHECDFGLRCIAASGFTKKCIPDHKVSGGKLVCHGDFDCGSGQVCAKGQFGRKVCRDRSDVFDALGNKKCFHNSDCEFNFECKGQKCVKKSSLGFGGSCINEFGRKVCSNNKSKSCFNDFDCR